MGPEAPEMSRRATLFRPSMNGDAVAAGHGRLFWLVAAVLAGLGAAAYTTITLDHPFGLATNSRALYVDGGFYSDAAQNFIKFGRWGLPFDFPHWAGAPLLTFIQSVVFAVFGASLETARLLSVAFGLVTALAFYSLLRMGTRPAAAALLTIAAVLTFNYVVHARSAIADPTAVCFGMLALLAYARVRNPQLAIPASVALAFLALLSKMYFVFTLATIAGLWLLELWLVPAVTRTGVRKRQLAVLGASLAGVITLSVTFLYVFGERLSDYYTINASKIPYLDPAYLRDSLVKSIQWLPFNTKADVFLWIIAATAVAGSALLLNSGTRTGITARARSLSRGELAVVAWLLVGLATIGVLQLHKSHYHYFAILPLALAGAVGLKLVVPGRLHTAAICAAAAAHLLFQAPFYIAWAHKPDKTAIYDASREVAGIVDRQAGAGMVPVIGEYSAQLGLFSDRVFSLDAKWSPSYPLCQRVSHWTPRFHVNIVWPGSVSQNELGTIARCPQVDGTEEIARFTVFEASGDEMVLSRIHYKE